MGSRQYVTVHGEVEYVTHKTVQWKDEAGIYHTIAKMHIEHNGEEVDERDRTLTVVRWLAQRNNWRYEPE